MISSMEEVASVDNIQPLVAKTNGVGNEVLTHILGFLASYSISNFPKEKETAMLALNAATSKRKVCYRMFIYF